ncbi:MAG: DedA family protein [Planctomycetes bacterium]|nr:DedA family protein [Planctomycetota bacterium]
MMDWLLHEVLRPFAEQFSYVGVSFLLLLTGLGLPCPEDVLLLLGGFLVYKHEGSIELMIVVSLGSVLLGDLIMFGLGRRYGRAILHWRLIRSLLPAERVAKIEGFYLRHGKKTIFFGRFAAGLRWGIFLLAGTLQMSVVRFVAMDLLAALLSVPALVWMGQQFGDEFELAAVKIAAVKMYVIAGASIGVLCYAWWRHRRGAATIGAAATAKGTGDVQP